MKQIYSLLMAFLLPLSIFSQELDLQWSEVIKIDNARDGRFNYTIGANSKYQYARFVLDTKKPEDALNLVKLVMYDVNTLEKIKSTTILDVKKQKIPKAQKGLSHTNQLVSEDAIIMFYKKTYDNSAKIDYYAESFDNELGRLSPLKHLYTYKPAVFLYSIPDFTIVANNSIGKAVLVRELNTEKGKDLMMEYTVLNNDLSVAYTKQVSLPIKTGYYGQGLVCNYSLGNDGRLHLTSKVTLSKAEAGNTLKGERDLLSMYAMIDLETGTVKHFPFKLKSMNLFDFKFITTKEKTHIYGFYSDVTKDKKGQTVHGIMYATINSKTMEMESSNLVEFEENGLSKLLMQNNYVYEKGTDEKKKNFKEAKHPPSCYIEEAAVLDNNGIVLFLSNFRIVEKTWIDYNGIERAQYWTLKEDIAAVKLNTDGEIKWAGGIRRSIQFDGYRPNDLKVITEKDKVFLLFSSTHSREVLDYVIIEYDSGEIETKQLVVSPTDVAPEEKKLITLTKLVPIQNRFLASCYMKPVNGYSIGYIFVQ